jgi:hypothetical protein
MTLQDKLCFVQFIHPGGEHQPNSNGSMNWNRVAHKRKFVEIAGRCHRQGTSFEGPLRFWAEWEPESNATEIPNPLDHGPRFVHRPFYVIPKSYKNLQNTDPFVFGGFFYTGCQQYTRRGPTQLRYLERGSVILFGSCVDDRFAIDTVFVVAKWEDHDARNFRHRLKNLVPEIYYQVTLSAWYSDDENTGSCGVAALASYRLYFGAAFEEPVDGMFSFSPCMPASQSARGFARPVIEIPAVITPHLLQGRRLNRGLSREKVIEYWNCVRHEVESNGLWLGVHVETPKPS